MYAIRKVKTWHGLRWGIVNTKQQDFKNASGKKVLYKAKEIDVAQDKFRKPLLFPYNSEGFKSAQAALPKN